MAKSKRSRPVALTKTEKRTTRDHKAAYIEQVRQAIDQHNNLYLFSYENMRSNHFQNVRLFFRSSENKMDGDAIPDSHLFLGKNKLIQIALGRTVEDEYEMNLRNVSKLIVGGSIGLLITSHAQHHVEEYFNTYREKDYARAGTIASQNVVITSGMISSFPVGMMEQLRKLGLPIEIKNGNIVFINGINEYCLCKEGETLSAEKCKLLVQFQIQLSTFKVSLVCRWGKLGEFHLYE